jgi:hypothetical protein
MPVISVEKQSNLLRQKRQGNRVREIEEPTMLFHIQLCASLHSENAAAHGTVLVKYKTASEVMNFEVKQSHGSGSCIWDFGPKTPL